MSFQYCINTKHTTVFNRFVVCQQTSYYSDIQLYILCVRKNRTFDGSS